MRTLATLLMNSFTLGLKLTLQPENATTSKNKLIYVIGLLLWLSILLPTSLDGILSVKVSGYNFRATYLFTIVALAFSFLFYFQTSYVLFKNELKQPKTLWLLLFLAVGLTGIVFSIYVKRSVFVWTWTAGTILSLPFLARFFIDKYGSLIFKTYATYVTIQSLLVIYNYVNCDLNISLPVIGRIIQEPYCRPFLWYYEPNYLAGFLLLAASLIKLGVSKYNHRFLTPIFYIVTLGASLTGSRLGLLGAILFFLIELILSFKKLTFLSNKANKVKILSICILTLFMIAFALTPEIKYGFKSILEVSSDVSFNARKESNRLAFHIFQDHPLVGVGPGVAKAYILENNPDNKLFALEPHLKLDRDAPLAHSVWGELLSEWGFLGFIFYLIGLFKMLRLKNNQLTFAYLFCALILNYSTAQTIPRFDIWLTLSIYYAILVSSFENKAHENTRNAR